MTTLPPELTIANQRIYFLHPGDVVCAERGDRLDTLLGSCVAIVLTDHKRTVGAMCHIVHSMQRASSVPNPGAYASAALARMYALLQQRGFAAKLCEAYVYGGGNMFPDLFQQSHVGETNSRWALAALHADGVRVLSHDLGGNTYRRLSWVIGSEPPTVTAVSV